MAADGLVQEHIDTEGADSLLPASKEPLHPAEVIALLKLQRTHSGTVIQGIIIGDNMDWQGRVVMIALLATMGCRKEAIALGKGETLGPRKITLSHVIYRPVRLRDCACAHFGAVARSPAESVCRSDGLHAAATACKNDPTGAKFGNSPVPSRYHPTRPINLARELIKYEIRRATPPERRAMETIAWWPGKRMWTNACWTSSSK